MIQLFKPYVTEEAIAAVSDVLRSGWIGLGPKTVEFEKRFAEYVGSKYAVGVNSATSALHLALITSGVSASDEVLTTPMTFVSTNHAILYQQAVPVFVDVEESTLNIDLAKAKDLITPRTKAIIAVHYGGNPVNISKLYEFAYEYGLNVIEDAAHACGASFQGRKIGSFGLTCFSFHAVKNLPLGDGGMITTDNLEVYEQLMRLRWVGIDRSTFERNAGKYQWEYDVKELGYKYHINDIASAIGIEHLKMLDTWNKRRQDIVNGYRTGLSCVPVDKLSFVNVTPGAVSSNHLCVIRVKNRDAVVDELKKKDIGVGVHYKPNNHYAPFKSFRQGDLNVSETAYREIISLPLHLHLTDEDVLEVCTALSEIIS